MQQLEDWDSVGGSGEEGSALPPLLDSWVIAVTIDSCRQLGWNIA